MQRRQYLVDSYAVKGKGLGEQALLRFDPTARLRSALLHRFGCALVHGLQ